LILLVPAALDGFVESEVLDELKIFDSSLSIVFPNGESS
jgi:hypothetical protein